MSPEKILNDPSAFPFIMAMAVKGKNFVVTKGLAAFGASAFTFAFSIGVFYGEMKQIKDDMKLMQASMVTMQSSVNNIQTAQIVTNNNMIHIVNDIEKITAQVGELMSYKAKLRR
jgi:hypothetical protein